MNFGSKSGERRLSLKKAIPLALLITFFGGSCPAQTYSTQEEAYATFFSELNTAEEQSWSLWDMNMYGPLLLVNPKTREVFANYPDKDGALQPDGNVYHGTLPAYINIYNTIANWNGREWAMVMLPLPGNKQDRIDLMAHELFHVVQGSFGFRGWSPDNSHLDDKNGRILMRLEVEALRKALESTSTYDIKKNLTNALIFREYRYMLFPQAKISENLLELNEGLAEYTGTMVANRTRQETLYHFEVSLNAFVRFPTFVRSFAYETIPIYGYLLQQSDKYWNKRITPETNLADFFIQDFGLSLPSDLPSAERSIEDLYDGALIRAEETNRQTARQTQVEKYREAFVNHPHFEIRLENKRIQFDPTGVVPLDNQGTVYTKIRIVDNWGILDAQNGALLSPRWDKITVSNPTKIDGDNITGDGWTLQLDPSYTIVEDYNNGNYRLSRR
jgi:hypothetical protein